MTKRELMKCSDSKFNSIVKIAGTNYDRRRKVTKSMRNRMNQMYDAGKSIYSIADHFNVSPDTVKRTVDEFFNESEKIRKRDLNRRMGYRTAYDPTKTKELADYKRNLIKENKKLIISVPS